MTPTLAPVHTRDVDALSTGDLGDPGATSDWYESVLGRVAREGDQTITALLRDPGAWRTDPELAHAVTSLYQRYVTGDTLSTLGQRLDAWTAEHVTHANRDALVAELGRQNAIGMGFPLTIRHIGSSSGSLHLSVTRSPSSRGPQVSRELAEHLGFEAHVRSMVEAFGVGAAVAETVVRHEMSTPPEMFVDEAPHRNCRHDLVSAAVNACLSDAGLTGRHPVVTCDGVCRWLAAIPLEDLRNLLVWGWIHTRAPFAPELARQNFAYHGRAVGAEVPRTAQHKALGFCKRAMADPVGAELTAWADPRRDDALTEVFDGVRDAMLSVLGCLPLLSDDARVAASSRIAGTTLRTSAVEGTPIALPDLMSDRSSAIGMIERVNPDRLAAWRRGPRPVWDTAYFDHRRSEIVVGLFLRDSHHMMSSDTEVAGALFTYARIGFVVAHELAHALVPRTPAGVSVTASHAGDTDAAEWLSLVRNGFRGVHVDLEGTARLTTTDPDRTLREDAADVLGLAAAYLAAARHSGSRPTAADRARFCRNWWEYWQFNLPAAQVRRLHTAGSHSIPVIRQSVPPTMISVGTRRLIDAMPGPALRRRSPACVVLEEDPWAR